MALGGRRPRPGRTKDSTVRPALRDFYTLKELREFFDSLKERAKTSDVIAELAAKQILGKVPQPLTGPEVHSYRGLFASVKLLPATVD